MDTEYFVNADNEPCIKRGDVMRVIQIEDYSIINETLERFQNDFPESYDCVSEIYSGLAHNRWLMVRRLIRCNFGVFDTVPDIASDGTLKFEHVPCPLRGECKYEGKVCHPKPSVTLTGKELEILLYIEQGLTDNQIGDIMFLSGQTITTHRRNIRRKMGVHNNAGIIDKAKKQNII